MKIKYFAINVESNTYRRNHILAECARYDIPVEIFKAITPKTIETVPHQYNSRLARNFTGRDLKLTEIACGLSHISLWRQLMNDDEADYYAIMEDDVQIKGDIMALMQQIDLEGIDFLKFSGTQKRKVKKIQSLNGDYGVYQYPYGPLNSGLYMLSKKGAFAMNEFCQTLHAPIDILMDKTYDHGVTAYGVLPYPVSCEACYEVDSPLYTDIGLRDDSYKKRRSFLVFVMMRYYRWRGSVKRRISVFKLRFFYKPNVKLEKS